MIDYKEILRSKPHNPHYLKKYISFIERHLNDPNDDPETFYEKHHILPKSADLFPEYSDLRIHKWNMITLPYELHVIAHLFLWRAFGGSQRHAAWCLRTRKTKIDAMGSRTYMFLRQEIATSNAERGRKLAEEGRHNTQLESTEGRHYWQSEEYAQKQSRRQLEKVALGEHVFQTEENRERTRTRHKLLVEEGRHPSTLAAEAGTHYWQSEEHRMKTIEKNKSEKMRNVTRERNLRLSAEGKHPAQQPERRKMSSEILKARWEAYPILVCPHCHKETKGPAARRWHFDNCKLLPKNQTIDKP